MVERPSTKAAPLTMAAIAALWLGFWTWQKLSRPEPPPTIDGYALETPRGLPDVELRDDTGATFTPTQWVDHWSFLYFGYTYCPDVCPLTLLELAALKQHVSTELPAERAEFYFVSVDPARDSPERLHEYVRYFDPSFHGLTGPAASVQALADATETLFFVPADQGTESYLVSHSNHVVLLNPLGELQAIMTPPHTPESLAASFAKVVEHYRKQHRD